jgi:glyoxylase-like metal-dependent hydrolase (beta-lactamase superfamily II)
MTAEPGHQPHGPVDGSGTGRAFCVLAPNPSMMTLDGTNTWLIAEPDAVAAIAVDPGPLDEGHLQRVTATAAARGAPVRAVDPEYRLGSEGLAGGDVVTAGGCELRVIATPGHTTDSVCLFLPADGAVLTGDTVLGRGTTVIGTDGNLADYLDSLHVLRALADEHDVRALLPGHGPMLPDAPGTLDYYLTHRAERLAEVRRALDAGDRTLAEIVARVYAEIDKALWPFAEWSVRAQLEYLRARGGLPPGVEL